MGTYNKALMALLGALAAALHGLIVDGDMSRYDWWTFLVQAGLIVLVWWQANGRKGEPNHLAKFVAAAWTAASAIFLPAVIDGVVTGEEWGKIGIAAATALLVYVVRNTDHEKPDPEVVDDQPGGGVGGYRAA